MEQQTNNSNDKEIVRKLIYENLKNSLGLRSHDELFSEIYESINEIEAGFKEVFGKDFDPGLFILKEESKPA